MMMMGRPGNRPGARPGGAGFMGMGMPVEKSKDFRGTLRRLVARLRPERLTIAIVVVLASASVVFSVVGPKLIGNATNVIFEGVIGKTLPAGITKDQAVEALRLHGQSQLADMLSGTSVVPGAACAARSRQSSRGSRCGTSTAIRTVTCFPASRTTSTTSRRRCNRA